MLLDIHQSRFVKTAQSVIPRAFHADEACYSNALPVLFK